MNTSKGKPLARDAFNISEETGLWAVGIMSDYLERYYSDLYGSLLSCGRMFRMFPKLSGNYEIDKEAWKKIVDDRNTLARQMRDIWDFAKK